MKPARIVTRWSPILLNKQYVSLCGEDQFGDAWVSTTLAELDIETMTARTVSGRPYRLYGDPDPDYALEQALGILSRAYDLTGTTVDAISLEEADAWLRGLAEKPALSDEDMAANEDNRRRQTWASMQWEASESGLTAVELAEVTGLPVDVFLQLHRGVAAFGDVPTDVAEEGLGRLLEFRQRGWRM